MNSGSSRSRHSHVENRREEESYESSLVDEAAPISLNDSEDIDYLGLVENRCHNGHTLRA